MLSAVRQRTIRTYPVGSPLVETFWRMLAAALFFLASKNRA